MVDNYGNADVYRGHIEGDLLIFESFEAAPARLRSPGRRAPLA